MANTIFSDEQLTSAVKESGGILECIRILGLNPNGSCYDRIRRKTEELNLDTSHWQEGKVGARASKPLDEILIKNSPYLYTNALKIRLVRAGILEYKCWKCGISDWQGQPLTLQLDHANGDRTDNRIENLRILCPNCHAQTPTHGSKNIKRNSARKVDKRLEDAIRKGNKNKKYKYNNCSVCNAGISWAAEKCKSCYGKEREKTKIEWPPTQDLYNMVKESSYREVAAKLGVSDNAVRKRILRHP